MKQPSLDLGGIENEFSLIGNDHQTRAEAEEMRYRQQVAKDVQALNSILAGPTVADSKEIDPAHVAAHFQIHFITGA